MRDRRRKYIPNPFFDDQKDLISDVDELLADYGMDDIVRGRGPRQGLDKMARSMTGSRDGVIGSQFRRVLRPDRTELPSVGQFTDDDYEPRNARGSLVYKDPDYYRNEYNSFDDLEDFDIDAEFIYNLENPEEDELEGRKFDFDDDMDDEELDFGDDNDTLDDSDEEDMNEEESSDEEEDLGPKYEGVVRAVKGAYLVSRKEQADETFTEVWIYNVGKDFDCESNVRKAILAGTDIDPTKNVSEDKSQEAVLKTVGNVQFLTITGLQS
jgi:hypothetical protein